MTPSERQAVYDLALALWRQREMRFPAKVRIMHPDEFDRTTATWAICWDQARERLGIEEEV